jgi:hypothetical protein
MSIIEVLLPRPQQRAWSGGAGTISVAGKTVAVVNNGWNSSDEFAIVLDRVLREDYGVANVLHFRDPKRTKDGKAAPVAPPEWLDEIASAAPVALTMLGN